jgi:hypothetical protein
MTMVLIVKKEIKLWLVLANPFLYLLGTKIRFSLYLYKILNFVFLYIQTLDYDKLFMCHMWCGRLMAKALDQFKDV